MTQDGKSPVSPPPGVPKSIVNGMQRQDEQTIVDIISHCKQMLDHLSDPPEELEDEGEEVINSEEIDGRENWTKVVKRIPCGKNCNGCPHGPYLYLVRRVTIDRLEWKYVGKVSGKGGEEVDMELDDDSEDEESENENDEGMDDDEDAVAAPDEDVSETTYPDQQDDEDGEEEN